MGPRGSSTLSSEASLEREAAWLFSSASKNISRVPVTCLLYRSASTGKEKQFQKQEKSSMNSPHSSSFQKSKETFPGGGGRQHGLFFHPPRAQQLERESSEAVGMCDTLKASTVCHVMGEQCMKLGNRNLSAWGLFVLY